MGDVSPDGPAFHPSPLRPAAGAGQSRRGANARLKVPRHPSLTMEHLWLRILALAWNGGGDRLRSRAVRSPRRRTSSPAPRRNAFAGGEGGEAGAGARGTDVAQNAGARVAVLFDGPRRIAAFVAERQDGNSPAWRAPSSRPLTLRCSRRSPRGRSGGCAASSRSSPTTSTPQSATRAGTPLPGAESRRRSAPPPRVGTALQVGAQAGHPRTLAPRPGRASPRTRRFTSTMSRSELDTIACPPSDRRGQRHRVQRRSIHEVPNCRSIATTMMAPM